MFAAGQSYPDLSCVGFVPVGDLLDMAIQKHFTFVARINRKISIYFCHEKGTADYFSLIDLFFVFLVN
jgi:hypothetical protein